MKVAEGLVAKLVLGQYPLILLTPDVQLWKALTLVVTYLNRQGHQDYRRASGLPRVHTTPALALQGPRSFAVLPGPVRRP